VASRPKRKPPTWAKKATPPPLAEVLNSPKLASMSWQRNHNPRKIAAEQQGDGGLGHDRHEVDHRKPARGNPIRQRQHSRTRSAGDLEVVANVDGPTGHLRGDEHRVVFGPGADMAGQRDDAVLGVRPHVAAVRDQRRAVQRLLDVQVDVDRVGVVTDVDIVPDVADTGQSGNGPVGGRVPCRRTPSRSG
jgi:hypothetical protein